MATIHQTLELEFDRLKKEYLRLRKGVLTQIWIHEMGTGPLPQEKDYAAVQKARDELEECFIKLKEQELPRIERERARRASARAARKKLRDMGVSTS